MLYAIIDEEIFKIVWHRDLDFMLTFERDGCATSASSEIATLRIYGRWSTQWGRALVKMA
jgi:hypothetical protein